MTILDLSRKRAKDLAVAIGVLKHLGKSRRPGFACLDCREGLIELFRLEGSVPGIPGVKGCVRIGDAVTPMQTQYPCASEAFGLVHIVPVAMDMKLG